MTRPRSHSKRGPEMGSKPEIFPRKAARTRPFQGGGGICPQRSSQGPGGPSSFILMPSSSLSSLPHSLRKQPARPGPRSPRGLRCEQEPPEGWDRTQIYREKEAEPQGDGQLSPTPTGFRGRKEKGAEANWARLTHTAADSRRAATPGKIRAAATAKAKDRGGRGCAVEVGCACALGGGRRSPGGESGPGAFSCSPSPEVKGLPGGALPWGRGRRERGLRTL